MFDFFLFFSPGTFSKYMEFWRMLVKKFECEVQRFFFFEGVGCRGGNQQLSP